MAGVTGTSIWENATELPLLVAGKQELSGGASGTAGGTGASIRRDVRMRALKQR